MLALLGAVGGVLGAATVLVWLVDWLRPVESLRGKHVIITGGSSGIGLALAFECVSHAPIKITIMARNKERLETARQEIAARSKQVEVQAISVDSTDFEATKAAFQSAFDTFGPVALLIHSVGSGMAYKFEETPLDQFDSLMRQNYLSAVYAMRSVMPFLVKPGARVMFLSSQAGQIGIYGYSAYSPTKFALSGLSQVLAMEYEQEGIRFSLAFPPDTDTEGYREELKIMPAVTRAISATSELCSAECVAKDLLNQLLKNRALCSIGLNGKLMAIHTAGFAPPYNLAECLQQIVFGSGTLRIIGLVLLTYFQFVIRRCKSKSQ